MTQDFNKVFIGIEQNIIDSREQIMDSDYNYTITADLFNLASKKHNLTLNSDILIDNYIDEDLIKAIYDLEVPYRELKTFFSQTQPIKRILINNLETFVKHISDLGSFNDYVLAHEEFNTLRRAQQKASLDVNGRKAHNFLNREYRAMERYIKLRTDEHPLLYKSAPKTKITSVLGITPEKGQLFTYTAAEDVIGDTKLFKRYFGDR